MFIDQRVEEYGPANFDQLVEQTLKSAHFEENKNNFPVVIPEDQRLDKILACVNDNKIKLDYICTVVGGISQRVENMENRLRQSATALYMGPHNFSWKTAKNQINKMLQTQFTFTEYHEGALKEICCILTSLIYGRSSKMLRWPIQVPSIYSRVSVETLKGRLEELEQGLLLNEKAEIARANFVRACELEEMEKQFGKRKQEMEIVE